MSRRTLPNSDIRKQSDQKISSFQVDDDTESEIPQKDPILIEKEEEVQKAAEVYKAFNLDELNDDLKEQLESQFKDINKDFEQYTVTNVTKITSTEKT
jgi:hypothetical protein